MKSLMITAFLLLLCGGCGKPENPWKGVDANKAVPAGDPQFTPLTTSWVIDNANVVKPETIQKGDAICQRLKQDGIAEMVVLVQNGVKHPEDYATHYGRWLGLGKATAADEGGQNGLVWLIRPDAEPKMTYSRGRGLPAFTSSDAGEIMDKVKDFMEFNNFDKGVAVLIEATDKKLRDLHRK
jgi:hypothetical protein